MVHEYRQQQEYISLYLSPWLSVDGHTERWPAIPVREETDEMNLNCNSWIGIKRVFNFFTIKIKELFVLSFLKMINESLWELKVIDIIRFVETRTENVVTQYESVLTKLMQICNHSNTKNLYQLNEWKYPKEDLMCLQWLT